MFNILYQDFYIVFSMYNIRTWTIGLLLYWMFSINTLTHVLEYKRPYAVGLSDYWTIAMFNILYQDFYIFPMYNITTWTIGLLDYCSI